MAIRVALGVVFGHVRRRVARPIQGPHVRRAVPPQICNGHLDGQGECVFPPWHNAQGSCVGAALMMEAVLDVQAPAPAQDPCALCPMQGKDGANWGAAAPSTGRQERGSQRGRWGTGIL